MGHTPDGSGVGPDGAHQRVSLSHTVPHLKLLLALKGTVGGGGGGGGGGKCPRAC